MLPLFNGLILDVVLIVLLLTILAIGAFKGILHAALNFLLLAISLILSFMPFTDILKVTLVDMISPYIDLGAISLDRKLGAYMSYTFIASLVLTLLFYVILRLLKYLIFRLVASKKKEVPTLPKAPSRICGAVFSLLFNGFLLLSLLSIFSTDLIGGNKALENGYVAKHIDKVDDELYKLISDDKLQDKLTIMIIESNLLLEVSNDDIANFKNISSAINNEKFIPKDLDDIQKDLDNLHSLLSYVEKHGLQVNGVEVDGYELIVEQTRAIATNSISAIATIHTDSKLIDANKTLAIKNLLIKFGLKESANLMDATFVIK